MIVSCDRRSLLRLLPLSALAVAACGSRASDSHSAPATVRLANPLGPTVLPLTGITGGAVHGSVDVPVHYWRSLDEAVGLLASRAADLFVLPVTTAANLQARGTGLALLAVHEWRVFSLLATSSAGFTGWSSTRGKAIYLPEGRGETVDLLTRVALQGAGIAPDRDVRLDYAPAPEIVALLRAGRIELAALPEPFATQAQSGRTRIVLDYQNELARTTSWASGGIPVAGLFARADHDTRHRDRFREATRMFAASLRWANAHPGDAIALAAKVVPVPAAVMTAALPRIEFRHLPAAAARHQVTAFLTALHRSCPADLAAVPGGEFFATWTS
jgi:NitT/TauT family transport system substrate-binding protein